MADFDPDAFLAAPAQAKPAAGFDPDAYLSASPSGAPSSESPDHGLSERQKLTPLGKAISPITSYPETYSRMNKEAREQVGQGISQIADHNSAWDVAKGVGNTALGSLGYVASPISAAYRSVVGQPIEDVTGIPREYTEFAAQLATPGIGLTGATRAPSPSFSPSATTAGTDVVAAADRASQVAPSPINVPRAFASDNIAVQRAGQLARNVPIVGDSIPRATGEMVDQMGNAVKSIATHYGEGSGPNVASRIGQNIGQAAERETTAAADAARASDDAVTAAWQRSHDQALEQIRQHETNALDAARQATGDMSPQDMGAALIDRLRTGEQDARALKDRLYATAGERDASVRADSVQGVHNRISSALDDAGRVVDAELTPAANRMMGELKNFSSLRIPNRVGPPPPNPAEITSVDARGMEQVRKRLGSMAQAATNDADRAASRIIMRQFDDWQANAYDNALFSGSPEALQSFRDARAANASWRQRFYNDRDDADRLINKVVTGEVTPQEMSNWLVGSSQIGSKGTSSRLLTRLTEATGNDQASMDAIRSGVANRLFGTVEGVTARNPAKIANDINEFFNGSGRDVANRLYTPPQRQAALNYASTLRRSDEARTLVGDSARNTTPSAMTVGPGPMQELASTILGKGGKTDEALFSAIDSYARSGARGDIHTLADIVRAVPEKDKGDLAGAIIRKIGQSKVTGEFSPDLFASEWSKYTPQAKTVLLGNAGPHRQALDDIAMISQRYKDVGRRFGNPSGTGQQVAGLGALASVFTHPYVAIPSLVGGAVFAKILSTPATAQRAANWGKTVTALSRGDSPARISAFEAASKSLAAASNKLGANISPFDLMRSIQGPSPVHANQQQQQ